MAIDYAKLESKMFRVLEISDTQASLKEEKARLKISIAALLKEEGLSQHSAKLDENFELKVTVKPSQEKVFEKERMADDLGVTASATQKKDFLINMTEKGKLNLETFKKYFHYEPKVKFSIRKIKKRKNKK